MSAPREPRRPPAPENETLSRLLRLAGPRPEPEPGLSAQVKAEVRAHWQRGLAERTERRLARRRRLVRRLAWAAVAGLLALALGVWAPWRGVSPEEAVGAVELVRGAAWSAAVPAAGPGPGSGAEPERRPLERGMEVAAGAALATGPESYLAVRLADGTSLRLDSASAVAWRGPRRVELERGAVYVDSGDRGASGRASDLEPAPGLEIVTRLGTVQELGTRFEVRLDGASGGALSVRVRAGRVALVRGGTRWVADAGEALAWSPGPGLSRRRLRPDAAAWSWTLRAAPPYPLEGSTLEPFLAWVARETGWRVRFRDPAARRALAGATLHGSLEGVRPDQAPAVVLPAVGLTSRLEDGVLEIEAP